MSSLPSFSSFGVVMVEGAGKHTYIVRLQAATELLIRLPSLHPTCLPGCLLLQRPSSRERARHRWNFLLSNGPTKLVDSPPPKMEIFASLQIVR